MSESGDIGGRSFYRFLNRKFFSELGEAVHTDLFAFEFPVHVGQSVQPYRDDFVFPVFLQCNPFGIAPVFFRKKPHAEGMDTAPAGRAVLLIPTPYFPVVGLSCFQFFSFERNKDRGGRKRFSAVPDISIAGL